jgi:hypothetical protein
MTLQPIRIIRHVQDSTKTALRWIGTVTGGVLMAFGLRTVLIHGSLDCRHSGIAGPVCSGHPPAHPHAMLGLLAVAVGLAVLVGSRRYFSQYGRSSS